MPVTGSRTREMSEGGGKGKEFVGEIQQSRARDRLESDPPTWNFPKQLCSAVSHRHSIGAHTREQA